MKRKIKLLKDHHSGKKAGDIGELDAARAEYMVRTGQAEYVESNVKATKEKPTTPVKSKNRNAKGDNPQAPCLTC